MNGNGALHRLGRLIAVVGVEGHQPIDEAVQLARQVRPGRK